MLNQMLLLTVFVIDTFRMRNPWFQTAKPLVLRPETKAFRP